MDEDLASTAKGELPWPRPDSPDEAAYQSWKRAVDDMWLSHATLDAHHALTEKRAKLELALARNVRQQQELSATRTIFQWLRRRRLHVKLAHRTSRRQQCEANLARLRYKDDCCARAALANANRHRPAVAHVRERPVHTAALNDVIDDCRRSFDNL
jgi:hypothetical protein